MDPGESFANIQEINGKKAASIPSAFTPPPAPNPTGAHIQMWNIKSGKFIDGPFSFTEILAMIKEGSLCEDDMVKKEFETEWVMAKDCEDFSAASLKKFKLALAQELSNKKLFQRAHRRTQSSHTIWCKNEKGINMVRLNDVSAGGCSFSSQYELKNHSLISLFINANNLSANGQVVECKLVKEQDDQWYMVRIHLVDTSQEWKLWVQAQESAA
jgi:hypothetical protein